MRHKKQKSNMDLFRSRLDQIIDLRHPLCKLARAIDWTVFEEEFGAFYSESMGRPAKPIRLLVGLHYLKHAFDESDESVLERFLENPYWQYFCGFEYFQHELPVDPTTPVKWRKRVGSKRLEALLKETVSVAEQGRFLKRESKRRLNVDTTVQEKAISFPTDARLYHKMRIKLVEAARSRGIRLRQSYTRLGGRVFVKQHRYRHANQHKRARKMTKKLKTYLGRVLRDIERKVDEPDSELAELLAKANRLLMQERKSKNKLYSIHAPEVECISKGKAHKRYEFGCKVGIVSTSRDNWIVGIGAFHGNPYDGHTLSESLAQSERIMEATPEHVYVDLGYRGHNYQGSAEVHIAWKGPKKKSRWDKLWRRRRAAVEPVISHVKHDNRMIRNYLKGKEGDKINAVLDGCGYNIRKLLKAFFLPEIRAAFVRLYQRFLAHPAIRMLQLTLDYAIIRS
jgi:IS5 family transposase